MPKTPHAPRAHGTCAITGRSLPERELVPAALVRPTLLERMRLIRRIPPPPPDDFFTKIGAVCR